MEMVKGYLKNKKRSDRISPIAGNSLDNLWILSREKTIPAEYKQRFLAKAKSIGYNTDELIWVEHNK